MNVVNKQQGAIFFLYGNSGMGKTFMGKTLTSALQSQHQIMLTSFFFLKGKGVNFHKKATKCGPKS